ncbi:MAG: glycosyltransferase family 4 protein [Candidatus Moranbacteria bacterium]|jgi:phosphatidylinositol alpha-1,6-mannosyltransferase|nr:glycosyltransferase family 4 protein [Candidatus Moranbacteria bacterium]
MKKILLVTRPIAPPWDEASKNFAFTLAKDLSKNENLELHLMTNGVVSELPKEIIQEQVYTQSQNDFDFYQKIRSLFFQLKNKDKFDITHYFFTPTKFNSFIIKNFIQNKNAKSIQTVATLRQDLFSDEELKNLMFGDLIITYSDFAKEKLLSLGIKNVERIYPGIDLENYSPKETRVKNENYALDDFVINFAGEYTRLGAMDDVVEAFIEVSGKIPTAKLSMAVRVKNEKDADKKNEVVEKLRKNNLLEKVVFHDDGKFNMADIYNLADISIFPVQNMRGKFDVPLVVVEAMACAKPVIISNIPILEEFSSKENSVQIEAGNVEQLTAAILELHDNPEERKTLGISAREYVKQNFDIKNVSKQYAEVYESI